MKKVLIVDDDSDIRDSLAALLSNHFMVSTAASGSEAAILLEASENPDLILLDVQMDTPREGLELAKKLEASASPSEIPIILITCIETISASDATAEIVRKTLTKYRQNDLDVLIIMSLNGEIKVEYKSADDNSLVRLQVEGYHPKPINTEKLIREINQLLNQ